MKKLMLMLFLFATTLLTVQAQEEIVNDIINAGGKTPQEKAEKQAKKLTEKLTLTAEQSTNVQAALLERDTQIQLIRTTVEKGEGKRIQALKAVKVTFDGKMKTILTPEQYTRFEALREDRMEKRMNKGRKGKGEKGDKE